MNNDWLSHLDNKMMKGARNNNLCSYLIALEGWRRGLTLTWYSDKVKKKGVHAPGRLFTLSSDIRKHEFYKAQGDKVTNKAIAIAINKYETKNILNENDIPVPKGEAFSTEFTNQDIIDQSKNFTFPLVLKPRRGSKGRGVIANIRNESELKEAVIYLRDTLGEKDVLLEDYVTGQEYRFYVMEDRVLAVLNRIPANVTGNGKDNISDLIKKKNKERRKNPRLYSCLIRKDQELYKTLKKNNLSLEYIPNKNEIVYLSEKSNISSGGDSIDFTEEMPDEIKQIAINALKSISGLPHGGLDMIVNLETKYAAVIEINPIPQIGSLVFPMKGKSRDIPSEIIDYYFPETIGYQEFNSNIFFDSKIMLEPLINKSAKEITVVPAPMKTNFIARKYIVSGKVQGVGYRKWIRRMAIENDLSGFVKNENDNNVTVVVAGDKNNVSNFIKYCKTGTTKSNVNKVQSEDWNSPIKVGFHIIDNKRNNLNSKNRKSNISLYRKVRKKLSSYF